MQLSEWWANLIPHIFRFLCSCLWKCVCLVTLMSNINDSILAFNKGFILFSTNPVWITKPHVFIKVVTIQWIACWTGGSKMWIIATKGRNQIPLHIIQQKILSNEFTFHIKLKRFESRQNTSQLEHNFSRNSQIKFDFTVTFNHHDEYRCVTKVTNLEQLIHRLLLTPRDSINHVCVNLTGRQVQPVFPPVRHGRPEDRITGSL